MPKPLPLLVSATLAILAVGLPPLEASERRGPQAVDYQEHVKPILRQHCWACHGALKQEAGLRLDAAQLIRKGSDDGPVVIAGQLDHSPLWQKITAQLPDRMPPEGKPLSKTELDTLKTWIRQGAKSPVSEQPPENPTEHWAFNPIRRPAVPRPKTPGNWPRNPIDSFVAARHTAANLTPRSQANRSTLHRRVVLDLTGLPPTRDQLHRFLADTKPGAYQRLVQRLLSSPLYGQRWGRHWMDVWRYSDWYGRRGSNEIRYSQRHIWRWRDWIIESLNQNTGYDRMLLEMLAADEIAPGDDKALRATGFLGRNWYKFDRNAWLFETVERTSQGLLGLTFRCARCHDHKFDPVTQHEYYRFRAFFEPHGFRTEIVSADVKTEIDNRKSTVLSDGLPRVFDETLDAQTFLFIRGDDRNPDTTNPLTPGVPAALGGKRFDQTPIAPVQLPPIAYVPILRPPEAAKRLRTESLKVQAAARQVDSLQATIQTTATQLVAARKSPATSDAPNTLAFSDSFKSFDKSAWKIVSGSWSVRDGQLVQTALGSFVTLVSTTDHPRNFQLTLKYRTLAPGNPRSVGFSFDHVGPKQSHDIYTAISPNAQTSSVQAFHRTGGREIYPSAGIRKAPGLKIGQTILLEATVIDRSLTIVLDGKTVLEYTLPMERRTGKFALWAHQAHAEFDEIQIHAIRPTIKSLEHSLAQARSDLPVKQAEVTLAQTRLDSLAARIAAEQARHTGDPGTRERLALTASRAERQIAVEQARLKLVQAPDSTTTRALATAIAARNAADGSYTPFPATYPKTSTGRRTALARWMTRRDNPRTARVAINQIWLRHTGQRFVNTVSDFGLRSKPRDFPLLMDWLSAELIESGWDMKHIHRLIVSSATYRMSSSPGIEPAELLNREIDPDNSLLWRMNSRRMEAEVVRDSLLAIADTLDPAFGGPDIPEAQGQSSPRRSLYFRTTPDNKMLMLELFDLANPNECYDRQQSVVPGQALVMTNSPLALDRSRRLARRLANDLSRHHGPITDSNHQSLVTSFTTSAFEIVLGRRPSPEELTTCIGFVEHNTRLLIDSKSLTPFPKGTGSVIAASTDPLTRALENLVHVLLSHNDFVTIR